VYTDGLVEVPGESIDEGLERLRRAAASEPPEPERLCDRLVAAMAAGDRSDDIALLAMRILPLDSELRTPLARAGRSAGADPSPAAALAARAGRHGG
jgi:hypothetical protein